MPEFLISTLLSSVLQFFVVLVVASLICWHPRRVQTVKGLRLGLGLFLPPKKLLFRTAIGCVAILPVPLVLVRFGIAGDFFALVAGGDSPAGRIALHGASLDSLLAACFYAYLQTGASEELLFRGVIAKALFERVGFVLGNLLQAGIFAFVHILLFSLLRIQLSLVAWAMAFFLPFVFAIFSGTITYRWARGSIVPSAILHGSCNLSIVVAAFHFVRV